MIGIRSISLQTNKTVTAMPRSCKWLEIEVKLFIQSWLWSNSFLSSKPIWGWEYLWFIGFRFVRLSFRISWESFDSFANWLCFGEITCPDKPIDQTGSTKDSYEIFENFFIYIQIRTIDQNWGFFFNFIVRPSKPFPISCLVVLFWKAFFFLWLSLVNGSKCSL